MTGPTAPQTRVRGRSADARAVIELLADPGCFASWDEVVTDSPASSTYLAELTRARKSSGLDEAVLTGLAHVAGRPVVLVVGDFGFLAGSIGTAAAHRIVAAISRATDARLPVLACTASGGTRMQEGTPAFVRMLDIGEAIVRHRAEGLPYLVHLRSPTTGGVMASWGALGQVTMAEPGALLGFLGPRVVELLTGTSIPDGVQTSENLAAHGHVDSLVPLGQLRDVASSVLAALLDHAEPRPARASQPAASLWASGGHDVWASVEETRRADRIQLTHLHRQGLEVLTPLAGTGHGQPALTVALIRCAGRPAVLVAQDRRSERRLSVGDLRAAQRGIALAAEWGLPLITLVDTAGAELSAQAENEGLAFAVAQCIAAMKSLAIPTVSVLLGQGAGGAALALFGARHTIATQHAWLSPLSPEGASAILYRDTAHGPELAREQQIGAADLFAAGVVKQIVPEPVGQTPDALAASVVAAIADALGVRITGHGSDG